MASVPADDDDALPDVYYCASPVCPDYLSAWAHVTNNPFDDEMDEVIGNDDDWLNVSFAPVDGLPTFLPLMSAFGQEEPERVLTQINAWRQESVSQLTLTAEGQLYCGAEQSVYDAFIITTPSSDTLVVAKNLQMAHTAMQDVPIEELGTTDDVADYTVERVSPSAAATWLEDTLLRVTVRPGGRWFLLL
jgi:hypothetical protein